MRLATNFLFHLILFSFLSLKARSWSGITYIFLFDKLGLLCRNTVFFLPLKSFLISCSVISAAAEFPG